MIMNTVDKMVNQKSFFDECPALDDTQKIITKINEQKIKTRKFFERYKELSKESFKKTKNGLSINSVLIIYEDIIYAYKIKNLIIKFGIWEKDIRLVSKSTIANLEILRNNFDLCILEINHKKELQKYELIEEILNCLYCSNKRVIIVLNGISQKYVEKFIKKEISSNFIKNVEFINNIKNPSEFREKFYIQNNNTIYKENLLDIFDEIYKPIEKIKSDEKNSEGLFNWLNHFSFLHFIS